MKEAMGDVKRIEEQIGLSAARGMQALYGAQVEKVEVEKTKRSFKGHLTVVVYPLLAVSHRSAEQTAQELGEWLRANEPAVADFSVIKGFLNLSIGNAYWIELLGAINNSADYGKIAPTKDSPLVMLEYSSPNTNKPLHLGHIRNNLLGYSLANILEASGCRVVRTNLVNDRGIHICKSMLAWQKWGGGETPASSGKKGDRLVGDYYVLFEQRYRAELRALEAEGLSASEAEARSTLMAEAHKMLRRWENNDPAIRALWKIMNGWVYAGFEETYRQLGVVFDKIYYESETYLEGKSEVLRGVREGLFEQRADGSVWANLTADGLDEKLLLRADGTSVYMTQDIGTAKRRFDDFPIDRMIYVVGNEQDYHFRALSILLDRLGFAFGKGLVHFSYGMVELPEGKMKSREGTTVDADDLIAEMIAAAGEMSRELGKASEMLPDEAALVARIVGLGALKYFILKVDPRKNMTFNPKESIDFNGHTGTFIQYAYARIRSALRKAAEQAITPPPALPTDLPLSDKEQMLVQMLADYPTTIAEAAQTYSPALVANYAYELAKEYNQFYHDHPILREPRPDLQAFRLVLSDNIAKVIRSALNLLGIDVPERM